MDWSMVQGLISLAVAVAAFYFARKKDTSESSERSAKVIANLEKLSEDVADLKQNIKEMRREWHDDHDVLMGLSREMEAMWKIVDKLQKKEK